jgi:hypothetical protein
MVTSKKLDSLQITNAEWASSWEPVIIAIENTDSKLFSIVPVRVSNVTFVSSFGWENVSSSLTNGENTVAIIAVTTDASSNTKSSDGSALKTELESMKVSVGTDAPGFDTTATWTWYITNVTVKRVSWVTSAQVVSLWTANGSSASQPIVTWNDIVTNGINLFKWVALGADEELANSETAYYVVKATFVWLSSSNNKYIQLSLNSLDSGNVEYSSNDSDDSEVYDSTDNISALRLGTTSISGPSISSKY